MGKPKHMKPNQWHQKGKERPKSKQKESGINGQVSSDTDQNEALNFMTPEDDHLLQGVHDNEDVSDVEFQEDGTDVPVSEISAFIENLGLEKYYSQEVSRETGKQMDHQKKDAERTKSQVDHKEVELKDSTGEDKRIAPSSGRQHNQSIKIDKRELNNSSVSAKTDRSKETNSHQLQEALKFLRTRKGRKHMLMKAGEMWREEEARPLPEFPPDHQLASEAEALSEKLLEDEVARYSKHRENTKRSEARWLKTVLSSGTLSDKMAALTLLIQESPLHNLSSLENLTSMAAKKGRREAMMAVDTLRDLFLTGLLPDDRKLKAFNQQPLTELWKISNGNIDTRDKLLLMWNFENILKKKYAEFIKSIGEMSFDTVQATKEKSLSTIHQLLAKKPEQENVLLPMLVNKLGDPTVKSKATYLLTKLVDEHPNMKPVIVKEVQQLIYRPNVSPRAQYYAICYLNQLRLNLEEGELALQLIQIYFFFFKTFLKKGDVDNKMMSALLTGVNRAYVFAKGNKEEIVEETGAIYKLIPSVNFHTGVQALTLLFQVTDSSTNAADRYYTCLYRKLSDPALKSSAKQAIFMNLLFKSLKRDSVDRRIKAFFKRILQVYTQQQPHIICGILILLSQILAEKPSLIEKRHIAEGLWLDDEEEKFVDLPAPDEEKTENEKLQNESNFGKKGNNPDSISNGDTKAAEQDAKNTPLSSSWVHRINFSGKEKCSNYDPYNRNPLYSRAELDLVWELQQLTQHYHPSVRLYASSILKGQPINYDGDPLKDFTLIRFLDRFVYKNPKKDTEKNTSSVTRFKKATVTGLRAIPVNSQKFLEAGEDGVPEDEKFFYRYFSERARRKGEEVNDMDSDAGSVNDDEFDRYLSKFEKNTDMDDIDMDLDFAGDKKKTRRDRNMSRTNTKEEQVEDSGSDEDDANDDDDDDDDDDDLDLEDEELAAEFQKEMEDLGGDSDDDFDGNNDLSDDDDSKGKASGGGWKEEDFEFSPDEDDELQQMMMGGKKGKKRKKSKKEDLVFGDDFDEGLDDMPKKKKKKDKNDIASLFASAEEFSHLLEEDAESGKVSLGGLSEFHNKDKAAQKQIKWESDRDRWVHDKNRKKGRNDKKVKGNFKGGYSKGGYSKGGHSKGSHSKPATGPSRQNKKGKFKSGGPKGHKKVFGKKKR